MISGKVYFSNAIKEFPSFQQAWRNQSQGPSGALFPTCRDRDLPLVKRFMTGLLIFLANAHKGAYYLVLIGGLTT